MFIPRTLIVAAVALTAAVAGAQAATTKSYTFQPSISDLKDLDHYYNYSWGFKPALSKNEIIVEAKLTIYNIWDWQVEPDILYTTLLNNPTLGVREYYDDQGGGDAFAGKGTRVGTWTDPKGGRPTGYNLSYDFKALGLMEALNKNAKSGMIGFGFDPDCHYYNDGIRFEMKTQTVPEPATMLAMGAGLLPLIRRRRMARKA